MTINFCQLIPQWYLRKYAILWLIDSGRLLQLCLISNLNTSTFINQYYHKCGLISSSKVVEVEKEELKFVTNTACRNSTKSFLSNLCEKNLKIILFSDIRLPWNQKMSSSCNRGDSLKSQCGLRTKELCKLRNFFSYVQGSKRS